MNKNQSSTFLHQKKKEKRKKRKWPNSSQCWWMTPRICVGLPCENCHLLDLESPYSELEASGVTNQNLRTESNQRRDIDMGISSELWIELFLRPVLQLCVSKFVSIMTSLLLSRFSNFARLSIYDIMVYVHKDSACLFILNYYQNLYIKKTVHVQINSQNISIKKNVPCILLRFKKMFYILQTNIVKI